MKIPKQFQISKKLYTVSLVQSMSRKYSMGQIIYQEKSIQIARNSSDLLHRYTEAEKNYVFYHELTHAILEDMGHRLYNNEPFVEKFSKRLHEAIRTARV